MTVNVGNLIRTVSIFFRSLREGTAALSKCFPFSFYFPLFSVSFFLPFFFSIICREPRSLSSDYNRFALTAVQKDPRVINSTPKGTFGRLQRRCRKSRNHGVRFRNDWLEECIFAITRIFHATKISGVKGVPEIAALSLICSPTFFTSTCKIECISFVRGIKVNRTSRVA